MADLKITGLDALAEASIQSTDVLAIADISASETKKVTVKDLVAAAAQFLDTGDIPAAKVGSGISAGSLADGSVTNVKLANDSVSFGGVSVDLGAADATPAFNLSDATAYPTSALVGTITNAQLAGSIANAKLANSSVSLGGITVALGASDATPAFDLTDATSYKTTNLVGTITNAQLAGSIDVSKLVGSNVNFGGVTVALGGSDTTPAFNLSDATNYPTSALVGTITNAQLAGSIANTKLVANSITANELAANSVTDSELANLSVATGSVQDGAITNDKVQTSTNSSTGLDGATKIRDATITPAKLNTSNLDRSINVASGNLGINNAVTAATRSGISYNAQGLITGTVALAAADLPVATSSAVGGVSVGTGLSVNGSGVLSLSNSVTGATVSGITFSNTGQITAATALVAGDLPVSTTSAKGAVQITSGGGLTVDGSGNLTTSTSGISAGTYQSITVNNKGVATAGAALTEALIPVLPASKITSGSFDAARIANDSITGDKLSNDSVAVFQSIAQAGYPTAKFSGQILFDTVSEDAFIWDGNAWQAITTLTKGSLVFGGTYNANTSQMVATTSAGIAAGLSVGSNLPTASATTDGVYVVVSTSGTPSSPAPAIAFAPPDYILGVTNSAGSSWNEVDLSQTVAGQVASNITFTPYGQISSTNVQDAIQELETEKLALTGGTVTGQVLIGNTGSLVFEGSTIDAYETTLTVADPTSSDKTITFPDTTGTVITTGDTGTVTGTMLANGTIQNVDVHADAAIAFTKLADLTSAQILVGNGSNEVTAVAVTGDISINNAGLTAIVAGVIVDADISGSAAITGSKISTGTTSAVGVLQLTDSATSTSATTAATPAAVKIAKDAADAAATTANAALPKAGGTMTGNLILDNAKELRLSEADGDGANYTGLKAQAQSGDITLTLPAVAPTAGQVLKANASTPTTLEWGTDSATDNTKMPLAGGTFTNDVTFTGDSSNGLWDKSQSAFVANLIGNVTGNASGSSGSCTGNAATATALASARTIGGTSFDGTADIAVALSTTATNVTVADESSDTTCFPLFATAATGNLGAKSGSNLTFNSSSGALTATSFVGALTGNVTGTASGNAVLTGSTNNTIATVTGTNALTGEANLTFDGTSLVAETTIQVQGGSGDTLLKLHRTNAAGSNGNNFGAIKWTDNNSNEVASIRGQRSTAVDDADITFLTRATGGSATERMRIDSSGKVGIGTTNPGGFDKFGVKGTGNVIAAEAASGAVGIGLYENGTGRFYIKSLNGSDGLAFVDADNSTERMRIDSTGNVGIGTTPTKLLHLSGSSSPTLKISASDNSPTIFVGDANRTSDGQHLAEFRGDWNGTNVARLVFQAGNDAQNKDNGQIVLYTAAAGTTTEALRITEDQNATFAGTVSDSKGNLRSIPLVGPKSAAYTLIASDAGKHVRTNSNIEVPANTLSEGDAVTILNASGSEITITQGSGQGLYNSATAVSGNKKLAGRGMATILFSASGNNAYISGAGLSDA